ncbi:hypothetical protein EHQ82_21400 [Leptospira selangorensis]|uniref:Uncharacterized protein n=1 Tax=Leptospira selangorensis TaxID=2484982 RepID=A0ABY2MXN3_9LEPT|nr:hypothetical protein [Leptospira selangorensis]TGM11012.1 hypothetical protein EHQ82_21400 [Leptospira selangorensis]
MKLLVFYFLIFSLLVQNCNKSENDILNTNENIKDYESLLLENKNSQLKTVFKEKSVIFLIQNQKVFLNGININLDFQTNPDGSLSKPFPSSPCGIEIEGKWFINNNAIFVDGFWILPNNNCLVDFEKGITHTGSKKIIKGSLNKFRKEKISENDLIANFGNGKIVKVMVVY